MLTVYPYASSSLYTASYAISSSYAISASYIMYAVTASDAETVLNTPPRGPRGKSVCLLTLPQYYTMVSTGQMETCIIPP